jgi:hypothetical protein
VINSVTQKIDSVEAFSPEVPVPGLNLRTFKYDTYANPFVTNNWYAGGSIYDSSKYKMALCRINFVHSSPTSVKMDRIIKIDVSGGDYSI